MSSIACTHCQTITKGLNIEIGERYASKHTGDGGVVICPKCYDLLQELIKRENEKPQHAFPELGEKEVADPNIEMVIAGHLKAIQIITGVFKEFNCGSDQMEALDKIICGHQECMHQLSIMISSTYYEEE